MANSARTNAAQRGLVALVVTIATLAGAQGAAAQSDTTPPETTITEGPAEGSTINTDGPMFGWAASEAPATFACTADGVALSSCEQAFLTGASEGPHSFSVVATDAAGNTDPTPATRSFTIDLQAAPEAPAGCPIDGNIITGTAAADTRIGTAGTDIIFGRGGNDVLRGASRPDCVSGEAGNDRLSGGPGGDYVYGGGGNDRITGDAGNDELQGQSGNDTISGGSGNDMLDGATGADRLTDSSGRDTFDGGAGNDRITARDGAPFGRRIADTVRCGSGRFDVAIVDRRDNVARDCERVRRR